MRGIGFCQGEASPCIFVYEAMGILCSVHGDDVTSTAEKRHRDWLETHLDGKYELRKGWRLGPRARRQGADGAQSDPAVHRLGLRL